MCTSSSSERTMLDGCFLHHLDARESYTYLSVEQRFTQEINIVKSTFQGKYQHRLQQIWFSELSRKTRVSATNRLAILILLYWFGIVKWARVNSPKRCILIELASYTICSRHQGGRGLFKFVVG